MQDAKEVDKAWSVLRQTPNYDPLRVAEMCQWEEQAAQAPDGLGESDLTRLRELYLEMSPLDTHQYGDNYPAFQFRLGDFPLNLHSLGPRPIQGEIAADVAWFVEDRLRLFEEHQAELSALESRHSTRERAMKDAAFRELDDLRLCNRLDQLKCELRKPCTFLNCCA